MSLPSQQQSLVDAVCAAALAEARAHLAARLGRAASQAALDARLADGLRELNALLTSHRAERHRDYLSDPRLQLAYLAHHLPMHAAKVALLVQENIGPRPEGELRILDVGAGPLSGALGVGAALGQPARVVALDRVGAMMRVGAGVLARLAPGVRAELVVEGVQAAAGLARRHRPHVVVLANVVGELGTGGRALDERAALLRGLLEALEPSAHLLVLEPGTRIHAGELVAVRERLLRTAGVHVHAPCVGVPACPLAGGRDWCHADRWVQWPADYAALAARAGIRAAALKFSFLWLSRSPAPARPGLLRLIGGPMSPRPATTLRYACGPRGRVTLSARDPAAQRLLAAPPRGALFAPGANVEQTVEGPPQPTRGRRRRRPS
ncbi:MAG: hypothetical protein HY904_24215 [Deltaproteobacteria bacterium]|nr:hypothetical protein [Deltaproteobacteria bacterium]